MATVCLVDEDSQRLKPYQALNTQKTSREIHCCCIAVNDDDVSVIQDIIKNPPFADNPFFLNPHKIRFYAGCPLLVNGYRLGTLCITDTISRDFKSKDITALKDLASMAERELAAIQLATLDELTE